MDKGSPVVLKEEVNNLPDTYYKLLVENIADYAVFLLDPKGYIVSWNTGAELIKQYKAEEIIGKHFSTFYTAPDIERDYPATELREALKQGRFEDEGWRIKKDGSTFWANVIITPVYDEAKQLIGFSKVTRDLTEKKKLEQQLLRKNEELKESEERTRLLVDSVKDYAILMLSPDGIIMSWNAGAERMKGYKAQEIIGKHFSVFYDKQAVLNHYPQFELKKATENGQFEDEGWRIRKNGTAFWANVVLSPIYAQDKRLLGYAKVTRDLTERQRNEELMRRNQELVRINNELDNFVYTASHDLKAPIINLEGLLQALEEDMGSDAAKHDKVLGMMGQSIVTLKNVIADLADITRLEFKEADTECVSLPDLVEEIKASMLDQIAASNAAITTDFSGFKELRYSRKNLRSILFNLISNAIKYAHPHRSPLVSINTHIGDSGEHIVSVSDNGLGIQEKYLGKIFSMYKRFHDHVEGSGIGLYLVKKILNNSGDSITVNSELGKGTVFHVYFKSGSK